jgi:TorA maturation chaperone TorD
LDRLLGLEAGNGSAHEPAGSKTYDLDESALARAREYLLLANLFARPPTAVLLGELASLSGDASPLGLAHIALAEAARRTSPTEAASEYTSLFIGVGRGDILPYASYYLTGFLHERPLARIRQDLVKFGIERRADVFEPEDHIASLFEVIAGLIGGEFGASATEADRFFEKHIAPWAGRLMTDIAAAPSAHFYKSVAELGHLWLEIEREALSLHPGKPTHRTKASQ